MGRNPAADEKRRAARREKILVIAAEVITRRGAEGVVEAVAKRLGLSKGTIYLYFESKDVLVLEVFRRAAGGAMERMREIASAPADPAARLTDLVKTSIRFQDEQRLVMRMLMEGPLALRAEARRSWARPAGAIYRRVLDEGRAKGIFRAHDASIVSHVAVSLGRSLIFYEGPASMNAFADEVATLLVRSILATSPRKVRR